jgi:hypothetical protein
MVTIIATPAARMTLNKGQIFPEPARYDLEADAARAFYDDVLAAFERVFQTLPGRCGVTVYDGFAGVSLRVPPGLVTYTDKKVHTELGGERPDLAVILSRPDAELEHAAENGD